MKASDNTTKDNAKNQFKNNSILLLKDGDEFFPQLIKRIGEAQHEIFLETFILENDNTGRSLKEALKEASSRGVWVSITTDSYGTYFLDDDYIDELSQAGIIFQLYDPQPEWFGSRPKVFRRLHRKLVVIDNTRAFVGGINFCDDHLTEGNDTGKRDYAVEITGPVVPEIRKLCASYVREVAPARKVDNPGDVADPSTNDNHVYHDAVVRFVSRDNRRNKNTIEKLYIEGINSAKHQITIANAYFFPGYRVMKALTRASSRGVRIRLILQGDPDIPFSLSAARCLYDTLTRNNIEVYEYTERPLHGKIATIDNDWSSIGSSNLDPWSLSLNLEANVFVEHSQLNKQLTDEMELLVEQSRKIQYETVKRRDWWSQVRNTFFYHFLRRLPSVIAFIPNPHPKMKQVRGSFVTGIGKSHDDAARKAYPESKNAKRVTIKNRQQQLTDYEI